MPIETNLKFIESEAEKNWADNWNFRSYLHKEILPQEVDRKVSALNREVSAAIDCTACGNCCREVFPFMSEDDILRLAVGMKITVAELIAQTRLESSAERVFCHRPCPLLADNKCKVYNDRPVDCRDYPHLDKPDFLANSIGTIENYRVCPIVFNVYNRLKMSFSYNPDKDYIGELDPEAES